MNAAYDVEMTDEELTEAISLRITKEDRGMIDDLASKLPLKPLSIARVALRIGLKELLRNPASLFDFKESPRTAHENVEALRDDMTKKRAAMSKKKPVRK